MNFTILKNIKEATKAVPFVKYALALSGVLGVIALAKSYTIDWKVGVLGTAVVLCLMLVLFLLAKIAQRDKKFLHYPTQLLLWAIVILFVASVFFLVTCAFFHWPGDLASISDDQTASEVNYTIYLHNKYNSTPVNIGDGKLTIRVNGHDYDAIFSGDGIYKFEVPKFIIEGKDSSRLVMKEVPKYCFDNYKKEALFQLNDRTKDIYLSKDTNYWKISGNISYFGKMLKAQKVTILNTGASTLTDSNGRYTFDLPQSADQDHFNILVTGNNLPSRTYPAALGNANDFDIANH